MKKQATKKAPAKQVRNRIRAASPVSRISAECPLEDEVDGGQAVCNSQPHTIPDPDAYRIKRIRETRGYIDSLRNQKAELQLARNELDAEEARLVVRKMRVVADDKEIEAALNRAQSDLDRLISHL